MSEIKFFRLGVLDWAVAFCFLSYAASAVLMAICLVEMARPDQLDFTLSGGGAVHFSRMMMVFLVLFASGFLAARFGKCRSIGVSCCLIVAGAVAASFASSVWMLLPALILLGIGQGVVEGLLNPVIQDLHPNDSARYLNFLNAFWSIGVVGTMIGGGELLSRGVSWRALFFLAGFSALVPAFLFLRGSSRLPRGRAARPKKTARQLATALRIPRFWMFVAMMLLAGGAEAAFTYWSASYIQLGFGSTARLAGIAAAVFSAGMILTRFIVGALVRQQKLPQLMIGSAWAGAVVSALFPLVNIRGGAIFMLFMAGVTTSCFWPTIQSYAAEKLKADSTIIFILLSCAGIPGAGIMVLTMGMLADLVGLRWSFFVVPLTFLALAYLLKRDRRNQQ